jgi:hypothetical protein
MADVLDKCTIIEVGTLKLVQEYLSLKQLISSWLPLIQLESGLIPRLDTTAVSAELVNLPIFGCMAVVLDKSAIVLQGEDSRASHYTD